MVEYKQKLKVKCDGMDATYISKDKYEITTEKFRNTETKERIPFIVEYDSENDMWIHSDDNVFKKGVSVNFLLSENLSAFKESFDSEILKNNYI